MVRSLVRDACVDEGTVALTDGRALGYARFGAADGTPVVVFNGTPGSRWFGAFFHDAAREAGCSVVALERPGCGRSDPVTDRRLADWASDVDQATRALGIDEFGLVAFSGGAPHAFACAVEIPDRTTGIALASPACRPGDFENRRNRAMFWLARNAPRALSPLLWGLVRLSHRSDPEQVAPNYVGDDVLDVEVAEGATAAEVACADFREAFRSGTEGAVAEIRLLARPWSVDPGDVAVPVACWHSDADADVPIAAARDLCEEIPDAAFHRRTGEHHGEVVVRCRATLLRAAAE